MWSGYARAVSERIGLNRSQEYVILAVFTVYANSLPWLEKDRSRGGDEGNEKLVRAYDKKMQGLRDFPIGADFMG